jgi:hypothetical protein
LKKLPRALARITAAAIAIGKCVLRMPVLPMRTTLRLASRKSARLAQQHRQVMSGVEDELVALEAARWSVTTRHRRGRQSRRCKRGRARLGRPLWRRRCSGCDMSDEAGRGPRIGFSTKPAKGPTNGVRLSRSSSKTSQKVRSPELGMAGALRIGDALLGKPRGGSRLGRDRPQDGPGLNAALCDRVREHGEAARHGGGARHQALADNRSRR